MKAHSSLVRLKGVMEGAGGLSFAQVAELLHVSRETVRSWWYARHPVPLWAVELLAFKTGQAVWIEARYCTGRRSEDGGSGGRQIPCDGSFAEGVYAGGCGEPCSFVMHPEAGSTKPLAIR